MRKEELKEIAWRVNDILIKFIEQDKQRLKKAGSLRSVIGSRVFGKRIDFGKIWADAVVLAASTSGAIKELEKIEDNSRLSKALTRYSTKLYESILVFLELTKLQKEQGEGKKVTWEEYMALEKKYKQSKEAYYALAQELNDAFDNP